MKNETIETAIAYSGKAMYAGAGSTVIGGLTLSEFGVLFGALLGIAGFVVNTYFKWLENKRQRLEHERRMAKLESKPGDLHEL